MDLPVRTSTEENVRSGICMSSGNVPHSHEATASYASHAAAAYSNPDTGSLAMNAKPGFPSSFSSPTLEQRGSDFSNNGGVLVNLGPQSYGDAQRGPSEAEPTSTSESEPSSGYYSAPAGPGSTPYSASFGGPSGPSMGSSMPAPSSGYYSAPAGHGSTPYSASFGGPSGPYMGSAMPAPSSGYYSAPAGHGSTPYSASYGGPALPSAPYMGAAMPAPYGMPTTGPYARLATDALAEPGPDSPDCLKGTTADGYIVDCYNICCLPPTPSLFEMAKRRKELKKQREEQKLMEEEEEQ